MLTNRIFIRADLSFRINDHKYVYANQPVSLFGVMGIKWNHFDPMAYVGSSVKVSMNVNTNPAIKMEVSGYLLAEVTKDFVYLGIRFALSQEQRLALKQAIDEQGFYPADYIRKYPRIPADGEMPEMPMRAIVKGEWSKDLSVFDIGNISPGGMLLYSENQNAGYLSPGVRVDLQIEPRGSLFQPFKCTGLVCRQTTDMIFSTKALRRFIGLKFLSFTDVDRDHFVVMLKAVLNNLKQGG